MKLKTLFASIVLVSSTLLAISGCGRSDLVQAQCSTDSDCDSEQTCESGLCVDEQTNNANNVNNLNNVNNDSCLTDAECPDGEVCDPTSGACEPGECVEQAGDCVFPDGTFCDVGCEAPLVQQGCECEPVACQSSDDCEGFECVEGECRSCIDFECGPGFVCADSGQCEEDNSCLSDDQCDATRECRGGRCLPRPQCLIDSDCRGDSLCISGVCIAAPECSDTQDCDPGFECVGGNCFEAVCRGNSECEGDQICDGGECVDPPAVSSCFVVTPDGLISDGQRVTLEAFALDDTGAGVAASFSWSSSASDVASVAPSGNEALGGTSAGTATFTATLQGGQPVTCMGSARLTNPGPVTAGQIRISVIDANSGSPVSGAEVILNSTSRSSSAQGAAVFADPASAFDVTVRHPDYNWVTFQGVSSNDIRIPVSVKSGTGPIGGFTGEFDTSLVTASGDVTLGLAGASISGGLLNLNLGAILGEPFVTPINIPGAGGQSFPIPGGLIAYGGAFGFQLDIKREYYVTSTAGGKIGWGLAGKVSIGDLVSLAQGGGGGGDLLTTLLPLFNRFDHGSKPLSVTTLPRIVDTTDIDGDGDTSELVPDYLSFPVETIQPSVRQTLTTEVDVSNFPTIDGETAELAVLVGSTLLDSPGLVPLGISATADEDGDGRPDTRRLSIAPPAGSLVGGRYALVALAFQTDGLGTSFEFPNNLSAALWNGQTFPTDIRLGTFPNESVVTVNDVARTLSIQADAGPLYRVQLVGEQRRWDVWSYGSAGVMGSFTHTVVVPSAPSAADDYFVNGTVILDAIQTNLSLDDIVRATGVGLDRAGLVSTAFNRTEVR